MGKLNGDLISGFPLLAKSKYRIEDNIGASLFIFCYTRSMESSVEMISTAMHSMLYQTDDGKVTIYWDTNQ